LAGPAAASNSGVTAGERAQARAALLVLSDLPHGWVSSNLFSGSSNSSSNNDVATNPQLARCLGIAPSSVEFNPAQVQSPTFEYKPSKEIVENTIEVFRSAALAHNLYAAFTSPKAPSCLEREETGQPTTGTTLVPPPHVSFTRLPSPKGTVALGFSSTLFGGVELTFFTHAQFGDAIVFTSFGSKTPAFASLARHLLATERSRL
jgi:hypothetical protein